MNIFHRYNKIINTLIRNDNNATWDDIIDEMKENYDDRLML